MEKPRRNYETDNPWAKQWGRLFAIHGIETFSNMKLEDWGLIVSDRIIAIRELEDNPYGNATTTLGAINR